MKGKYSRALKSALASFGVHGNIVGLSRGPVVTLYEFEPGSGVRANKVINLVDDLARVLSVPSCRASVIPGRNVIGIEIPNEQRKVVPFNDLIPLLKEVSYRLPIVLGKTLNGQPMCVDITKMPHLLMAGTTGSGKSVAMNVLIASLITRFTPDECQFIMIDPKKLELSVYADIPHLLRPVVTEPMEAVNALNAAVFEMERRYEIMSHSGVRNITGFNEGTTAKKLPYIVVVIDEVADLMLVAGNEVEYAVQRLAQMARAAGIHVVMATQRPSVDVITGTIKANFPTRIAFAVASKIDSRTILGEQGAEQLLGMGDMLYAQPGRKLHRVHGAFISDDEIQTIVEKAKSYGPPRFISEAQATVEKQKTTYDLALELVLSDGRATASYLQRQLSLPYDECVKLLDELEKAGVVTPSDLQGDREIYSGGL